MERGWSNLAEIGIIGGDARELYLISYLKDKHHVSVLSDNPEKFPEGVTVDNTLKHIYKKEIIYAPMTGLDDKNNLKSTFVKRELNINEEFCKNIATNSVFLIGSLPAEIKLYLSKYNIKFIETAKVSELAIRNAIPTAEAAIALAIEEQDLTIFGSKVLITGMGKVGLTLLRRLINLGAETYAVSRDNANLARAEEYGAKIIRYKNLAQKIGDFDLIYNTVPAMIFDQNIISQMNNRSVIIDLASKPGGVDFDFAQEIGINAFLAPGLPGKYAPQSAGKYLADYISNLLKRKG